MLYYFYLIGRRISLILPLKIAYALSTFLADLKYWFSLRDRKILIDNLQAIFPDKERKFYRRCAKRIFRNFAKYLVDFFRSEKIDLKFIEKNVEIINKENLDKLRNQNGGVIILTAHLGNWELGGQVAAMLGYSIWAVALQHKDERINEFFNRQRRIKGVNIIPIGKKVKKILTLLKQKRILAFLGDRDFSGTGVCVDFFGRKSFIPKGAAFFSLRTKTPILPTFFIRKKGDRFRLIFEKPIYPYNKEEIELVEEYVKIMQEYIKRYPDQWFMFQRFWIEEK